MHQTTVRFGPDLWEALETECARLGVSAAQYLREAALARLAYTAGQRGDADYDRALVNAASAVGGKTTSARAGERRTREAHAAQKDSSEQRLAAAAVSAQSEQVRRRAQEIRAQTEQLRLQRGKAQ